MALILNKSETERRCASYQRVASEVQAYATRDQQWYDSRHPQNLQRSEDVSKVDLLAYLLRLYRITLQSLAL